MRWTTTWLAGALLVAVAAAAAGDDAVVMDNGARIEGRIVAEDAETVVIERTTAAGRAELRIPRSRIRAVEREGGPGAARAAPARPARDEWWLLRSDARTVGTRRLLLHRRADAAGAGWRIQEEVRFFASGRMPAVRVVRIEDVSDDWTPVSLHYTERGEGGAEFAGRAYEVLRSGPVRGGVWALGESGTDLPSSAREVPLPRLARGPLGMREALARSAPRPLGLVEMPLVDAARGEVRVVRAGFTGLGAGAEGGARADLLRVEDGDRALVSEWGVGDPPPCLREEVAPGVVALPCTAEQASAAAGEGAARRLTVPEAGLEVVLPGASWEAQSVPSRPDEPGSRLVARASSRLHMADLRLEWDPAGAGAPPAQVEAAQLARLRAVSPDLQVLEPRREVPGVPDAWRTTLVGTVRGERLRTVLWVAERGRGRAVLLAACPETAWPEAGPSVESMLASFRWL